MNNKLKPCPFCGSTRVRVMYSDINKAHVVYCTNCKASTNIAVREEDAIYLWNKRAEPERKWIPFDVALPKDRQKVLCVNKHGEMMVGGYMSDYGMTFPCYFEKPVAWMPIPKPWRGEE